MYEPQMLSGVAPRMNITRTGTAFQPGVGVRAVWS